jgi:hypothetical protein
MNWIKVEDNIKPQIGRVVICYCPEWCSSGYQIAFWNGKEFYFDEQPNDMFNDLVESWTIFMEAD